MKKEEPKYPVKHIAIKTCGKLYSQLKQTKSLYLSAPEEGISLDIEFADTIGSTDANGHVINSDSQVALCLHGAPGSHHDYSNQIEHLTKLGFRVIAPNFPTYKTTLSNPVFRHSSNEKKEYVKDFLIALGVFTIDVILSHSSAIYPSTLLWRDDIITVKSIVLINPAGHRRHKLMRPKFLSSFFVRFYQKKLGRLLVKGFGPAVLSVTGFPLKHENMDTVMLSVTTMVYSKLRHLGESLEMMKVMKLPVLLVISEQDALVETDISYELAYLLGANENHFSVFDKEGNAEKERAEDAGHPWITVLPEAGHYSFVNYPNIINNEISKFLGPLMKPSEKVEIVESDAKVLELANNFTSLVC